MEKREMLYEGKAKQVYTTSDPDQLIVLYKDDATAFNGEKKGSISQKGKMNNAISNIFFKLLAAEGIPTHLLEVIATDQVLVRKLQIIPLEVVVRNIAAGSIAKRLGLSEGEELKKPVLEFYYKNDQLADPLINQYHIYATELATAEEVEQLTDYAFKINKILLAYLQKKGIQLVDFKLEFGKDSSGKIYLADEISPDTCRFWDNQTGKKLDKDRFRRDLGQVEEAYQEILQRLQA